MLEQHIEAVRAAAREMKDAQKALDKASAKLNEAQTRADNSQRALGQVQRDLMRYLASDEE